MLTRKTQTQIRTIIVILIHYPVSDIYKFNYFDSEAYQNGNLVVLSGLLILEQEIYIELTRQSLKKYSDEQKHSLLRVISLKVFEFQVHQDKQLIKIIFANLKQQITYKAKDEAKMLFNYYGSTQELSKKQTITIKGAKIF